MLLLWDSLEDLLSIDNQRSHRLGNFHHHVQYVIPYNKIMAGSVMATVPVLLVFVVLQRYFIQGIALTGLKA